MRDLIKNIIREHTSEIQEARFTNYEITDEPYANIFYVFITEYNSSKGYEKSNLKRAFQYAIRDYTLKPHKLISKRVAEHFIQKFPNSNPFEVRWQSRKKFGTVSGGKSFLLFEHTTPVKNFLITLANSKTLEEVKNAMRQYSGFALLTRDEDNCLRDKGYTSNRPQGWRQAYESCNIELIDENQYNTHKSTFTNTTL